MTDPEVIRGINLWLAARKLESVKLDNRMMFKAIEVLQSDMTQASASSEYPWEILMRGYNDSAKGKVNG
jgi:hypothetical protein